MTKRLIIDLARCDQCEECGVSCGFYDCRPDAAEGDLGPMLSLREKATFELVCRRCEHASCIVACPFDALERQDDGIIKRHNLRCVSCKSCAIACPFGTIYAELLPFYSMSYQSSCKVCLRTVGAGHARDYQSRQNLKNRGHGPLPRSGELTEVPCIASCKEGALEYREILPDEPGIHIVDEFLAAKTRAWVRAEQAGEAAS